MAKLGISLSTSTNLNANPQLSTDKDKVTPTAPALTSNSSHNPKDFSLASKPSALSPDRLLAASPASPLPAQSNMNPLLRMLHSNKFTSSDSIMPPSPTAVSNKLEGVSFPQSVALAKTSESERLLGFLKGPTPSSPPPTNYVGTPSAAVKTNTHHDLLMERASTLASTGSSSSQRGIATPFSPAADQELHSLPKPPSLQPRQLVRVDDGVSPRKNSEDLLAAGLPNPHQKKSFIPRSTKNQVGKLRLVMKSNSSDGVGHRGPDQPAEVIVCENGVHIRPGQSFAVEWILPERSGHLVVGLVRFGKRDHRNMDLFGF
jgi:hypothetical protein